MANQIIYFHLDKRRNKIVSILCPCLYAKPHADPTVLYIWIWLEGPLYNRNRLFLIKLVHISVTFLHTRKTTCPTQYSCLFLTQMRIHLVKLPIWSLAQDRWYICSTAQGVCTQLTICWVLLWWKYWPQFTYEYLHWQICNSQVLDRYKCITLTHDESWYARKKYDTDRRHALLTWRDVVSIVFTGMLFINPHLTTYWPLLCCICILENLIHWHNSYNGNLIRQPTCS